MNLGEYAEKNKPPQESLPQPGECHKCDYVFSKFDDFKRRQVNYCTYASYVDGENMMYEISKKYECPLQLEREEIPWPQK
jgi:hypothetical protein